MKRLIKFLTVAAPLLVPFSAKSTEVNVEANPDKWTIQTYGDGSIIIWNVVPACHTNWLGVQSTAPDTVKQNLFSSVVSAKLVNKVIGILYDDQTCFINSFYIKGD